MARRNFMSGASKPPKEQQKDRFYPTPPEGTRALLAVESFDGPIWECAAGAGDMARVLEAAGHEVVATDLVDRGYCRPRIDFLLEPSLMAPNVVTNPPFTLAEQFVAHAIQLGAAKVALLVRLHFLEGLDRARFYAQHPPRRVWVFPWRLCITPDEVKDDRGGGTIPYAWFVWERGFTGRPELGWLPLNIEDLKAAA